MSFSLSEEFLCNWLSCGVIMHLCVYVGRYMCVCVCVCVCVYTGRCMYVHVYAGRCMYVCIMCLCHICNNYVYAGTCMCLLCVCVCNYLFMQVHVCVFHTSLVQAENIYNDEYPDSSPSELEQVPPGTANH